MPFSEYLDLIEKTSDLTDSTTQLFETAVSIALPTPNMYKADTEVVKILEKAITSPANYADSSKEQQYNEAKIEYIAGYMSFITVDGVTVCELRIPANIKLYFQTWLNLMESGRIDFIKAEMHEHRNRDEEANLQARTAKIEKKQRKQQK